MQAACRLHYDGMQEVAGCSNLHAGGCRLQQHACSLHAGCMQPALRFKCSRLHWNTRAHSRRRRRVQGVDALHHGVDALHTASTPCMQAASRLHAGRRRQENTPRMNMLILGVFFRAYFSIFSLWQHVVMSSRCHLRRTWPAGTSWLLFTSASDYIRLHTLFIIYIYIRLHTINTITCAVVV